jgi:general secretion pathway protein D
MHFQLLRRSTGLALMLLALGTASMLAMSPKRMYQQGEKAEASGDLDGAFTAYAAASRARPNEIQYQQAMERLRFIAAEAHVHAGEHQLEIGNTTDALREFLHALDIDPGSAVAKTSSRPRMARRRRR